VLHCILASFLLPAAALVAQTPGTMLHVTVRTAGGPVAGAAIVVSGATYRTDATGVPVIPASPGIVEVAVHKPGFLPSRAISALVKSGGRTSRLSAGTGFCASTPLTEETEAAGLSRLHVDEPLEAERGLSASFDLTRTAGPASYTLTLFASRISNPVHVDRASAYRLASPAGSWLLAPGFGS
jgi:hypothetical protein